VTADASHVAPPKPGGSYAPRGKRVPRVRQAKARVEGALDKDIIRRIVRAHINEVRSCYNQGLTKDPKLAGRVEIKFVIGSTGHVTRSKVTGSTLDEAGVSSCMAKAVKLWRFPKPRGGGKVVVDYPFTLSPG
jgi:outer membrane biosynthesis protein TonB